MSLDLLESVVGDAIMACPPDIEMFMANEVGSYVGGQIGSPVADYLYTIPKTPAVSAQHIKQDSLAPHDASYLMANAAGQGKGFSPDFLGPYPGVDDPDDLLNYFLNIHSTDNQPAVQSINKSQVHQQSLKQQKQVAKVQGARVDYLKGIPAFESDELNKLINPFASQANNQDNAVHYAGSSLNAVDPHFSPDILSQLHDIEQTDLWALKANSSLLPAPNSAARTTSHVGLGWFRSGMNTVSSFVDEVEKGMKILSLMTPETRAIAKVGTLAANHQEAILMGAGLVIGAGEVEAGMVGARTVAIAVGKALRSAGFFKTSKQVLDKVENVSGFELGPHTAEEANAPFLKEGMNSPYDASIRPRTIRLQQNKVLVRVYSNEKLSAGRWMMRPKELEGLTPEEIRDKFALPETPTHIVEAHLPKGTYVQLGRAAGQKAWGSGGATQYQSLQRVDEDWFLNRQSLESYLYQSPTMGARP